MWKNTGYGLWVKGGADPERSEDSASYPDPEPEVSSSSESETHDERGAGQDGDNDLRNQRLADGSLSESQSRELKVASDALYW